MTIIYESKGNEKEDGKKEKQEELRFRTVKDHGRIVWLVHLFIDKT